MSIRRSRTNLYVRARSLAQVDVDKALKRLHDGFIVESERAARWRDAEPADFVGDSERSRVAQHLEHSAERDAVGHVDERGRAPRHANAGSVSWREPMRGGQLGERTHAVTPITHHVQTGAGVQSHGHSRRFREKRKRRRVGRVLRPRGFGKHRREEAERHQRADR